MMYPPRTAVQAWRCRFCIIALCLLLLGLQEFNEPPSTYARSAPERPSKASQSSCPTVAPAPQEPSGTIDTARPTFRWSAVPGAASYKLFVLRVSDESILVNADVTTPSYTPPFNLLSSIPLRWKARATRDGCPNGPYTPSTFFDIRAGAPSDLDLAYRWAPIHYQDTDSSDYDADYLTSVDYDGDWITSNNWEHQDDNPNVLGGKVYFSVTETVSHWYIVYAFYHPRDWDDFISPEHENDMEGVLEIIRKDGTPYGQLEGMVTVAHLDFYSFTPSGSPFRAGRESIDGAVLMRTYDGAAHPTTFQEAKGHGAKAWNGKGFPGGDGVIYYPSRTVAEVPSSGHDRDVKYQLIDMFASNGLWEHRLDPRIFASWGTFDGDNGTDDAANAPWGWDDHNDGGVYRGELATDPAKLVSIYFSNLGNFSRTYLRNTYID